MNSKLKALVRRIWQRAYLDSEEECARWIEEYNGELLAGLIEARDRLTDAVTGLEWLSTEEPSVIATIDLEKLEEWKATLEKINKLLNEETK